MASLHRAKGEGQIGCSEMSLANNQSLLRNIPEERRSQTTGKWDGQDM